MSPGSYGEALSLLSVYMMLMMPATPFLLVVTKRVVELRGDGNGAGIHAFLQGLSGRIGLAGGGALLLAWVAREPLGHWLSVGAQTLPLFVLSVVTTLLYSVSQATLLGMFRWRIAIGLPVILGVARLVLSIVFVRAYEGPSAPLGAGPTGIFAAIVLSTAACFAGAYALAVRGLPPAGRYQPLRFGDVATAAALNGAFWFLVHVDTVYVNRALPELVDRGYAAAAVLARPIVYFSAGVNQVLFPFLASAATRQMRRRVLGRMFTAAVALGAAGLVVLSTAPGWLLTLTFGPAYASASSVLPTVAWMLAPFALVNVILYDALAREDRIVARWFVAIAVGAGALLALAEPTLNALAAVLAGSALAAIVLGTPRVRSASGIAEPT